MRMRRNLSLAMAAGAAWMLGSTATAFVAPSGPAFEAKTVSFPEGTRVLRPHSELRFAESFESLSVDGRALVKTDKVSGAVRLISGGQLLDLSPLAKSRKAEDFVNHAVTYLESHGKLLGVDTADLRLERDSLLLGKDTQLVKFRVHRDGLLIGDASVDFRFKNGSLLQVANLSFSEAKSDQRARITGLDQVVMDVVSASHVAEKRVLYRVESAEKGYALVRVVEFSADTPRGPYLVQVEAATGTVFEVRPLHLHLDGSASGHVYPRWYGEDLQSLNYPEIDLTYSGGTVTTDANGAFTGAPDGAEPGIEGFSGRRVTINPLTGSDVNVSGGMVRDAWRVVFETRGGADRWEDKDLAQSMVYYHVTAMVHRAKQYIESDWLERPLRANVNLSRSCNAHWDGSTINLYSAGNNCANTGLIADVTYHEWGHGLDANTGGISDGAFSEGYGDILSMIMTHSNILGIGFRTNGGPVRDLEPDKRYPDDRGEVHAEGLIIAGTFWDLFKDLRDAHGVEEANRLISKYAFEVIYTADRYTDVYDALLVIDDDNGDLGDGTPNYCAINKSFTAHGLATEDESCNLASVDEFELDDATLGDGDGVLEPGEGADLWMTARNASPAAITGLTGTLSVDGSFVSVTDGQVAWDAIPARDVRRSADPATLEVSATAECGSTFKGTIRLQGNGRTAVVSRDFTLGRLDGTAENLSASGLPMPIRDNDTVSASVTVDSAQWDGDVEVKAAHLKFDVTHTYVGDVTIRLVAPDGTSKEIFKGSGSSDDIHFDEDVTEHVGGLLGAGEWRLEVSDNASRDTGTLDAFELTLTPARFVCD